MVSAVNSTTLKSLAGISGWIHCIQIETKPDHKYPSIKRQVASAGPLNSVGHFPMRPCLGSKRGMELAANRQRERGPFFALLSPRSFSISLPCRRRHLGLQAWLCLNPQAVAASPDRRREFNPAQQPHRSKLIKQGNPAADIRAGIGEALESVNLPRQPA